MLEGILYDVDGTLIETERWACQGVQQAFRKYGIEISDDEYVRRWMIEQTCTRGALRDYPGRFDYAALQKEKTAIITGLITQNAQLMPGALELLDRFHMLHPSDGVVTSDNRAIHTSKLRKFLYRGAALLDYFRIQVVSEDTEKHKPDPEPYLNAVSQLGIPAGNILVIEDTPSGIKSAKAAGCKVIGFPNGFTADIRRFDFTQADRIVCRLGDITAELVLELFPEGITSYSTG